MRFTITSLMLAAAFGAVAQSLISPDGRTCFDLSVNADGVPVYTVTFEGDTLVSQSPLGLVTDKADYTRGLTLTGATAPFEVADTYSLPNIKRSHVDYRANGREYSFATGGDTHVFDVIVQVSDHNIGLRYRLVPHQGRLSCVVRREATGFAFPEGTTTFLCPQTTPMTGFASTSPSYETSYTPDGAYGLNGWGQGYTFPCLFKVGAKGWALVSETGIGGDYCGSRLECTDGRTYTITYPQEGEMNGLGSPYAGMAMPGLTPWRTITVGRDLAPIAETTIAWDLVRPLYEPSVDYAARYGRGTWSWIIGMDESCNYDEQKRYIDFAADLGYESVLVDALWDVRIGRDSIEALARYGAPKGVSLYLWYNSNGYWNDAWQSPRGIMDNALARRAEMAWMQRVGIRGIKVDFFGGDKQEMLRLYHDILTDANDYGLLVIFHGCTIPRGWERMYPNYAASEAVRASENLHFAQSNCDNEAVDATYHPFIRNSLGSMDFGGSTLNKTYKPDNVSGTVRRTSDVFALATSVLFQSPVQHFALAPQGTALAPVWAVDFLKGVPTVWDETEFVEGYPGQYVVMRRRSGGRHFIVGINAAPEARTITVEIPDELRSAPLELYADDALLTGSVRRVRADKKGCVRVSVPVGGGFVIVNRPDPNFHIYLCLGQSNMEGAAPFEGVDTVGVPERFRMLSAVDMPRYGRVKGQWYEARPPQTRQNTGLCPADYFGREMVRLSPKGVTIGTVTVAVGGCKLRLFDPAQADEYLAAQPGWMKSFASQYDGQPYRRLVEMARIAQQSGVIKGILLHQGCSDTGDASWPAQVADLYGRLCADLGLDPEDTPLVAGEMLSKESGGVCASMIDIVRTLPQVVPGARVVSSVGLPGQPDGLHFTAEGYRELGRRYARAMAGKK